MVDEKDSLTRWKEAVPPEERVHAIARSVPKPRSVSYIARQAAVDEETAKTHLEHLADINHIEKSRQAEVPAYAPEPRQTRERILYDLFNECDRTALIQLREELTSRVSDWQDAYDTESPSDLRERALNRTSPEDERRLRTVARKWESVEYRLQFVRHLIKNYAVYRKYGLPSADDAPL